MSIIEKRKTNLRVATISLLVMLVPIYAHATSYSSTLNFVSVFDGAKRTFSAGQMHCSMSAYSKVGEQSFDVTCYKDGLLYDPKIGTTKTYYADLDGTENNRYFGSGVASGTYYFRFEMDVNRGIPVVSNNVHLSTD